MLKDLIKNNRSYRRFQEEHTIDHHTLVELVDLARLSPSAANAQALKFYLSSTLEKNTSIFPYLRWAAYLEQWSGPMEGERPSAYIIILGDKSIKETFGCDHGIAAQSIMLGAVEQGLGGCIIASVQRIKLSKVLAIPAHLHILLVLALGKPKEKVNIEPLGADGDIRYWRDGEGVHHVPKRALEDIIVELND